MKQVQQAEAMRLRDAGWSQQAGGRAPGRLERHCAAMDWPILARWRKSAYQFRPKNLHPFRLKARFRSNTAIDMSPLAVGNGIGNASNS